MQAANMAQNAGCTTLIANGEADDPISSVLKGERRCTSCVAHAEPATSWAAWLTDRLQMAGSIVVSSNAAADDVRAGERGYRRNDVDVDRGDLCEGRRHPHL